MTLCCPRVAVRPVDALLRGPSACVYVCVLGNRGHSAAPALRLNQRKLALVSALESRGFPCPHLPPVGYISNLRAVVTPAGGHLLTKKLREKMGLILICSGGD